VRSSINDFSGTVSQLSYNVIYQTLIMKSTVTFLYRVLNSKKVVMKPSLCNIISLKALLCYHNNYKNNNKDIMVKMLTAYTKADCALSSYYSKSKYNYIITYPSHDSACKKHDIYQINFVELQTSNNKNNKNK
jgi:hypothetical protein